MATKYKLILIDILYAVVIALLLIPSGPGDLSLLARVLIILLAVSTRVWQHITYYRQTGRIY